MFDTPPDRTPLDAGDVDAWVEQLASSDGPVDDESRVEMLGALERLTCAAAGLQAEITARLDDSVRRGEAAQGIAKERQGRGVAAEVALARRESHHRGRRAAGGGRRRGVQVAVGRRGRGSRSGRPPRSDQVMADTPTERLLGNTERVVPVEVELVVSDEVLLGTRDDAAYLDG